MRLPRVKPSARNLPFRSPNQWQHLWLREYSRLLQGEISGTRDAIYEITNKTKGVANAKLNVKGVLYENVKLTIGRATEIIKDQKIGSVTVIENPLNRGLFYTSMSNININAADLGLSREHFCASPQAGQIVGNA